MAKGRRWHERDVEHLRELEGGGLEQIAVGKVPITLPLDDGCILSAVDLAEDRVGAHAILLERHLHGFVDSDANGLFVHDVRRAHELRNLLVRLEWKRFCVGVEPYVLRGDARRRRQNEDKAQPEVS